MRILFDGTCISEHSAGIGTYAYQLLQGLARRQEAYKVTVLCKRESNIPQGNNIEKRVINNRFWKLLPIDVAGRGERYDVYHQPNYIPHCFSGKKIVTIHDMSHKVYPQYHPWRRVMMLRLFEERKFMSLILGWQTSIPHTKEPQRRGACYARGSIYRRNICCMSERSNRGKI